MIKQCACIDTLYTRSCRGWTASRPPRTTALSLWNFGIGASATWTQPARQPKRPASASAASTATPTTRSVDPTQKQQYLEALEESCKAAKKVGAESVTIHSNALGDGGVVVNHYDRTCPTPSSCAQCSTTLKDCAKMAEKYEIDMNLEALNVLTDHVGNFLETTQMGAEMLRIIGSPRLKLLYDAYHMELNEGKVMDTLSAYIDVIGHIHIADAPGRHEPGTGYMNYKAIAKHIESLGFHRHRGQRAVPAGRHQATAVKAIMAIAED